MTAGPCFRDGAGRLWVLPGTWGSGWRLISPLPQQDPHVPYCRDTELAALAAALKGTR